MANANIEKRRIIYLELSEEEAYTLQCILNQIGGDPETSMRKHAASMQAALKSIGITQLVYSEDVCEKPDLASIDFKQGSLCYLREELKKPRTSE